MKYLISLLFLASLISGCASNETFTKKDIVELGKSIGPDQTLYYTKVTEVEILEIHGADKLHKKKPVKKPKNKKALPLIKITEGR